jgi:hypothetical protein
VTLLPSAGVSYLSFVFCFSRVRGLGCVCNFIVELLLKSRWSITFLFWNFWLLDLNGNFHWCLRRQICERICSILSGLLFSLTSY